MKRLEKAKAKVAVGMSGYSVLLTIPLSEIGIDPAQMPELRGVLGVIFSDPSGTNRVARLYWYDKSTGLVSDVPTESGLNAKTWGLINVDK